MGQDGDFGHISPGCSVRTRLFSCCAGSRAARYGAGARFGLVVTGIGLLQRVQDRAVGPFIAGATPDQRLERRGHLQHARDAPIQLVDVLLGQTLDVSTLARLVIPQPQQVRDLGHREAEVARTPDEMQPVNVVLGIGAVARIGAVSRRDQADLLVVADHFGRDLRGLGCFTDVHGVPPFSMSGIRRQRRLEAAQAQRVAEHEHAGQRHRASREDRR